MDRGRVIDLSGAEIRGDLEGRNPLIFLPRQPAAAPLVALDIGGALLCPPTSFSVLIPPWLLTVRAWLLIAAAGTLIKLVYTASCGGDGAELRFAKFERRRLDDCFRFIRAEGLLRCNGASLPGPLSHPLPLKSHFVSRSRQPLYSLVAC
jgi:type II pantothenate kinase